MRSFYENLRAICTLRGTTVTNLVSRLGYSTSKVSLWAGGSLPKQEVLHQLAEALNCRVSDFFSDDVPTPGETCSDADESDVLRVFRSLDRRDRHRFMAMVLTFEKSQD